MIVRLQLPNPRKLTIHRNCLRKFLLRLLLPGREALLDGAHGKVGNAGGRHLLGTRCAHLEQLHEVRNAPGLDDDRVHLKEGSQVPDCARRVLLPELRACTDEGEQGRNGARLDDRLLHLDILVGDVSKRDCGLLGHAKLGSSIALHILGLGALVTCVKSSELLCLSGRTRDSSSGVEH